MIRADQDRGVQEIGRADHGQRDVADQGNTVVERVELGDRLFDGTLNIERTEFALGYSTFGLYWGPSGGFWAVDHNPTALASNLRHTRVLLEDGNGTPLKGDPDTSSSARIPELETLAQTKDFLHAARAAHVPVTMDEHLGVHDWLTWATTSSG
jgi:hypothetical protein